MNDYLAKPIRPKDLQQSLDKWLQASRTVEAEAVDGNGRGIDWRYLDDLLEGDQEIIIQLVASFREGLTRLTLEIENAVEQDDADGGRSAAHALKGICASVGATTMGQIANEHGPESVVFAAASPSTATPR